MPIAIELAHPGTHKASNGTTAPLPPTAGLVYARSDLVASPKTLAVWRLAKAVFRSLDSSIHQVWVRAGTGAGERACMCPPGGALNPCAPSSW